MVRGKEISSTKRAQIHLLVDEGYTYRAIATRMGDAVSSVSRTVARQKELNNYFSRSRSGRPKVTTAQTDRLIRRYVVKQPFAASSEVKADIGATGCKISTRTIRRRLQINFGLLSRKPALKPRLSTKNVRDRLTFCRRYQHFTPEMWHQVMFSDESKISQFRSYRPHVRRPKNERFNTRYTIQTIRSAPSVMIWAAITASGRAGLHFVPDKETIRAKDYLQIIKEKVPRFMNIRGTTILQQDGAPCHNAKLVKQWIAAQDFELLQGWPGNSPDLNPIENCWSQMKECLRQQNCMSHSDLIEKIKRVWCSEITPEYCQKLVESMPSRIADCLANKGGHTKY